MNFFLDALGVGARQAYEAEFQPVQQPPPRPKIPPASRRVINSLKNVKITADDLMESTNRECAICLDEQVAGTFACKLACGHVYHLECLKCWLEKNCTCPNCRFELETDDPEYELDRKKRMKQRKPRYRMDELMSKKVSEIKQLARDLNVNISGLIDKEEIVTQLIHSGKIDVTEGVPVIEIPYDEFMKKGVGELRQLLDSFGLSSDGAIEKSELRHILMESGRIHVLPNTDNDDSMNILNNDLSVPTLSSSSAASINATTSNISNNSNNIVLSYDRLKQMSISQLRSYALLLNVNISTCSDKDDMIYAILQKQTDISGIPATTTTTSTTIPSSSSSSSSYIDTTMNNNNTSDNHISNRSTNSNSNNNNNSSNSNSSSNNGINTNHNENNNKTTAMNMDMDIDMDADTSTGYHSSFGIDWSSLHPQYNSNNSNNSNNSTNTNNSNNSTNMNTSASSTCYNTPSYTASNSCFITSTTSTSSSSSYAHSPSSTTNNNHSNTTNTSTNSSSSNHNGSILTLTTTQLNNMSIAQYRQLFNQYNISMTGLLEKSDMRERLLKCPFIRIISDE